MSRSASHPGVGRIEALGDGQVRKLPGITSSETLISFKVYSKKDLEAGFALGLD